MRRTAAPVLAPVLALALLAAAPAPAEAPLVPVTARDAFVRLVEGRALTALGVRLSVTADGRIAGSAFGMQVSGAWRWQDGYFCREMQAGRHVFGTDCQSVVSDGSRVRFTAERGTGERADLRLR
jgi:hypothetical protein